jgi:hypothetical protein
MVSSSCFFDIDVRRMSCKHPIRMDAASYFQTCKHPFPDKQPLYLSLPIYCVGSTGSICLAAWQQKYDMRINKSTTFDR